jgi:hypothetical protein
MSRFHKIEPLDFSEWFISPDEQDTFTPSEWILPFPWISMFVYTHMKATFPGYNGYDNPEELPKVLQIGCAQGADAVEIAKVLKLPMINGKLHIIDWFRGNLTVSKDEDWGYDESKPEAWKSHLWSEAKKFKVDDIITVFEGDSRKVIYEMQDDYYDMVFIDGGHEYNIVKSDIENGYKKLKSGGVMILDDVSGHDDFYEKYDLKNAPDEIIESDTYTFENGIRFHAGVVKAVREFFGNDIIRMYSHDKAYHFKK